MNVAVNHPASVQDVGVEHGGADAGVAQEFLDGPNIVSVFKQVGGEAVPEGVAGGSFLKTGCPDRSFHGPSVSGWLRGAEMAGLVRGRLGGPGFVSRGSAGTA